MAAAGVDTNRNGRANFVYVGADRNRDGIPDAVQGRAAASPARYGPPVLLGNPYQGKAAASAPATTVAVVAQRPSADSCDAAALASVICLIASLCTIVIGSIYIFLKITNANWKFSSCGLFEEDCNYAWRQVFTFRPDILLTMWTPLVLGTIGTSIHFRNLRFCAFFDQLLPTTYTHYAIFMTVTALFANMGYTGQAGVMIGSLCIIAAFVCVVAKSVDHAYIKTVGN
jgi:hypothetical protein